MKAVIFNESKNIFTARDLPSEALMSFLWALDIVQQYFILVFTVFPFNFLLIHVLLMVY